MAVKSKKKKAQNPLIFQGNRLMEAFAKSNDERDFYLDTQEGFILYADLDKSDEALDTLQEELKVNAERYLLIPKMTFYETKKLMENFVHEKVYDVDTKEKLMEVIQGREPREHFLEFIYDHHTELEKWQQYYQERSRIRIIEWLRSHELIFVFEEDLDLTKGVVEKLKSHLFDSQVSKEVSAARKVLEARSKVYYSNEALNPRPKRGRPPKQQAKVEVEPQITCDVYTTVPTSVQTFLFAPEAQPGSRVSFSAKYDTEEEFLASMRGHTRTAQDAQIDSLNQKLEVLRRLSQGGFESEALAAESAPKKKVNSRRVLAPKPVEEDEDIFDLVEFSSLPKLAPETTKPKASSPKKKPAAKAEPAPEKPVVKKKPAAKRPVAKKAAPKKPAAKKR